MTDKFSTIPLERLFKIFTNKTNLSALGHTENLIYNDSGELKSTFLGKPLATPFGVAAGPHTQMAQNIIIAYLSGARYIELKTVQVLDELEVSKPCIDMADEGYNCEWSQELKIEESFNEYLNAWIIIHVMHNMKYGHSNPGVIFNMSVGYDYEGILSEKVQWFLDKMQHCKAEKEKKINELLKLYPEIKNLNIPDSISDNVTISTMHGCPPDEIEKISRYLIEKRKLKTILKLNPTLLGKEVLREILNQKLNFYTIVPDEAFEHDLKYDKAVEILKNLIESAKQSDVFFGVKLTNTLESLNNKDVFDSSQTHMYMSGRALHPISINLAYKLQNEFKGKLNISFSAGADCFNIADIIACGLFPVTVSSDLLKPGGYARLLQYAGEMSESYKNKGASTREEFVLKTSDEKGKDVEKAALENLKRYSAKVLDNKNYKREIISDKNIKTSKSLEMFDCISAPCTYTCPTNQDIPEYINLASDGNFQEAFRTILRTNPFPNVLGMVCDHKCQTKCTRINYDEGLRIRDIKWYISENSKTNFNSQTFSSNGIKVAVIGAGPSGLSCAYFLRLAGLHITVFESKSLPGGMVSEAIPYFRLKEKALQKDIERIKTLGVEIHYNAKIDFKSFEKIKEEYNYIYIAVGAQKIKKMDIEGESAEGVIDPIDFLSGIKRNTLVFKGKNIAVIGGGNTAMDVARAALRLVKDQGKVSLIYRRTINEMPAEKEEIEALLQEGIEVKELTQPISILTKENKVCGIRCQKMKLSHQDTSGRTAVIPCDEPEFELDFDTIIPAIGQDIHIDFIEDDLLKSLLKNRNIDKSLYIGGDAYRGASTIVNAVADGKKAAFNIINSINFYFPEIDAVIDADIPYDALMQRRSQRSFSTLEKIQLNRYENEVPDIFYSEKEIVKESMRCLLCDQVCNICVTVCPNKANYCYFTTPEKIEIPELTIDNNNIVLGKNTTFSVAQKYQVINIGDFCNECGNCKTFCPTSGAPYIDKPKFYLTAQSFNNAPTGYYLTVLYNKKVLVYKNNNIFATLTYQNNVYVFETDDIMVEFAGKDFKFLKAEALIGITKEINLKMAAEMKILMWGAVNLY